MVVRLWGGRGWMDHFFEGNHGTFTLGKYHQERHDHLHIGARDYASPEDAHDRSGARFPVVHHVRAVPETLYEHAEQDELAHSTRAGPYGCTLSVCGNGSINEIGRRSKFNVGRVERFDCGNGGYGAFDAGSGRSSGLAFGIVRGPSDALRDDLNNHHEGYRGEDNKGKRPRADECQDECSEESRRILDEHAHVERNSDTDVFSVSVERVEQVAELVNIC
jgi:hypothetical protein